MFPITTEVLDSFILLIESVDIYVQEQLDVSEFSEAIEKEIMTHSAMQKELHLQHEVIDHIRTLDKFDEDDINTLLSKFSTPPF